MKCDFILKHITILDFFVWLHSTFINRLEFYNFDRSKTWNISNLENQTFQGDYFEQKFKDWILDYLILKYHIALEVFGRNQFHQKLYFVILNLNSIY
jgi:hypothetical protein